MTMTSGKLLALAFYRLALGSRSLPSPLNRSALPPMSDRVRYRLNYVIQPPFAYILTPNFFHLLHSTVLVTLGVCAEQWRECSRRPGKRKHSCQQHLQTCAGYRGCLSGTCKGCTSRAVLPSSQPPCIPCSSSSARLQHPSRLHPRACSRQQPWQPWPQLHATRAPLASATCHQSSCRPRRRHWRLSVKSWTRSK